MSNTSFLTVGCVLALTVGVACRNNPRYCEGAKNNDCETPWDGGSGSDTQSGTCSANSECAAPTGVCDVAGTMRCVACVAPGETDACTGTTPACGSDHACHACAAHSECLSDACLPDGSCGSDTNVAYVDPGGTDNTTCTKAMPCTKVAKALATGKAYVKFHGATDEQVSITNQNVTLLADPAAKLTSMTNGIVLEIKGTSQVSIWDLEISGASGATGYGISMPAGNTATVALQRAHLSSNSAGGLVASGGTLSVQRSTISGNNGGGISLTSTQFDLENNFIVANGSATSTFGGVLLNQITTGTRKLLFNTISNNGAATGNVSGIYCSLVNPAITLSDNIVYGNQVSGGGTQVGGTNCAYTYSDVGPDTVAGTGNINADPLFVDVSQTNFHLGGSSPCKDVADPTATLDVDVDGDHRPQGSGREMGADEVH